MEFVAVLLGGTVVIVIWSLEGPDDLQPFYLKHPKHAQWGLGPAN